MSFHNFSNVSPPSGANPPNTPPSLPPALPVPQSTGNTVSVKPQVPDYLIDYNERFRDATPALFRDHETTALMTVLIAKDKPNAVLVGDAGVGKTRIVENMARMLANNDPALPEQLRGYTIYELPLVALSAGTTFRGELEERINKLLEFTKHPETKAIVFIDEIHTLYTGYNGSNEMVADSLKPALARGDMRLIGATTTQEVTFLQKDSAAYRRMSTVTVSQLTIEQTREIVKSVRNGYSDHYLNAITVPDTAVEHIINAAEQHLSVARPDGALTILDKAMAHASIERMRLIDIGIINPHEQLRINSGIVKNAVNILTQGAGAQKFVNNELLRENFMHIRGQDEIIDKVTRALTRRSLGVIEQKKPLAMMFAGPSGVGKTEVARTIAQLYTTDEPIILNMTEYADKASVNKILGSNPGYIGFESSAKKPFDPLITNPYQVIVLDEMEKASQAVRMLFLSILDRGELTTNNGVTINFSKAIIIATTNAAKSEIAKNSSFGFSTAGGAADDQEALVRALTTVFPSEFIGRFDNIFAFNSLSRTVYRTIICDAYKRICDDMRARCVPQAAVLPGQLDDDVVDTLATTTYNTALGARPALSAVREWVENYLLDYTA